MKTSINYICGSVYVEATIQRIALFPVLPNGKKAETKTKCSILTEDGKVFSFLADMQSKFFDMLMLTKENDEVKFDYDPACSSLDYFTSKTIQA